MATTLIRNGCFSGALSGIMRARQKGSFTPSDYATEVNAADAIAGECITKNALLSVPMADADNALIGQLCECAAAAVCDGWFSTSATATDYAGVANEIVAMAKQGVAKLV